MDEKIKKLEEAAPTNSMSGVYQVSPSAGDAFRLGQPDAPKRFYTKADGTWPAGIPGDPNKVFYDRPAGYWGSGRNTTPEVGEPTKRDFTYADVTANGNTNTDQFIRPSDGKVYTALPEGSENFILGPLVTSYAINHGYDDYTNLGYIQKDTRQFVLLARIQGFFKGEDRPRSSYLSYGNIARTWDGSASQLTIYNSNFTLEYALWMKDKYEKGNFTPNFPFRFSGGIPVDRHPDDNSMGGGDILGTDDGQQSADGDTSGTEQDAPDDNDIESLDLWGLIKKGARAFGDAFDKAVEKGIEDLKNYLGDKFDSVMDSLIENLGKVTGLDSAANMLNNYDEYLKKYPNGSDERFDVTNDFSPKDLNALNDVRNNSLVNDAIEKALEVNNNPDRANKPITTPPNSNATTLGELQWELAADKVREELQNAVYENAGLDNSIHNNVQIDFEKFVNSGGEDWDIIKNYEFRPGGSVEGAEDTPLGSALTNAGVELDSLGAGNIAIVVGAVIAAKTGITGANQHGGLYNSPTFKYKVSVPKEKTPVSGDGGRGGFAGTLGLDDSRIQNESYLDTKKRILREIKQPVLIEATPKTTKLKGYRPNFKGKYSPQNTPDVTASKKSDEAVEGYNTSRLAWTSKDKFWKGYETTERMNVIYDRLGHGSQYFDRIVAENILGNKKMQEHFNILSHEKAMREDDPNYKSPFREIDESETFENKAKDPLFTKVAKKLKKEIDYPKKPAAKGYPNEAPPKVDPNTGYHPKFGKRYKYDKLDPISAKAMAGAPTGDPEIDANVKRQAQKEDWRSELKNLWLGAERGDWKKKVEEGMSTQVLTGIVRSAGNANLSNLPMGLTGDGTIAYGDLLSNTDEDPNTLTGDGEYTALTNMSGMFDAPDPLGVGQNVRHWSIADQEFTGTTNIGGGGMYLMNTIPGFQKDASRNVSIRGTHNVDSVENGGGYFPPSDGNVYLRFNGPGSPRFVALKPVNTTEIDTFQITASRRNNAVNSKEISGFVYDHRPMLYYWCGDHPDYKPTLLKRNANGQTGLNATVYTSSNIAGTGNDGAVLRSNENDSNRYRGPMKFRQGDAWRPIHMKPDGTLDNSVSPYIIDYERNVPSFHPDDAQVFRNPEPYSVPIPDWARGKSARYMIYQAASGSSYYNSFHLHSVQFQRRGDIRSPAITKSLSAVETSPFVRVGPTKKNEGGKERKKKVQDIIDSGLEYTGTKFSKDFPVRTRLK